METKRVKEYYSIRINSRMMTVLIERKRKSFDTTIANGDKWLEYMKEKIKDIFNTDEWSYLGDNENFTPEEEGKVMNMKLD